MESEEDVGLEEARSSAFFDARQDENCINEQCALATRIFALQACAHKVYYTGCIASHARFPGEEFFGV